MFILYETSWTKKEVPYFCFLLSLVIILWLVALYVDNKIVCSSSRERFTNKKTVTVVLPALSGS